MSTVMLFGIGDLGGWTLEFLARSEGVSNIIACDIREDFPRMKTECVAIGAGQQGYTKNIFFQKCDVTDTDATAELLRKHNPDVIYSALTLLGWMEMRVIPRAVGEDYHKATACLIPLNVPLIAKLMKARKKAGLTAPVINNSYPDVTNVVLWRNGLGPLVGGGNVDLIVSEMRRKVSVAEKVPYREVTVYLVACHAVVPQGKGAPFFLKVMVGDRDITNKYGVDWLLSDSLIRSTPPEWTTLVNEPYVAASAVRNITAIVNNTRELAHASGPIGLPGGYPIRIGAGGVEVALPEGLTRERAIEINLEGLKREGTQEIKPDGTVVLTEEAYRVQKKLYGMDLREFRFADMEDIGKELRAIAKKLVARYS